MCSPSLILRNILEGQGDADAYKELVMNLPKFYGWQEVEMMRQRLWCMHDLVNGGGLGFTVQLFFLALSQLLPTFSSIESDSHSALYKGTFQTITSDWRKHKHCVGTQNLLLHIVISRPYELAGLYPAYIIDEFLSLLGNVLEGQTNPYINRAREHIEQSRLSGPFRFKERALRVLARVQAQSLAL